METEILEYYDKIKQIESLKETIKLSKDAFEESIRFELDKLKELEEQSSLLKDKIKEESISKFKETGIKQLDHGLGIRVSIKLDYSEEDAIKWAKENMSIAVKEVIDKKQFETYAKNVDLPIVNKVEEITVAFPKELK